MPTPSTLGKRIAQARRELAARLGRDVGLADMAKAAGVTTAAISLWEADERAPREEALAKLAKYLGVTPAFLRYGIQTATPIEDAQGETVRVVPSEKRQRLRGRG